MYSQYNNRVVHKNTKFRKIIEYIDAYSGRIRYFEGIKNQGQFSIYENKRKIFYLMAPSYGNVGDEAIVEATLLFLKDTYRDFEIIVVDFKDTYHMLYEIRRIISKEDIIVLQGGGNIGTLYYEAEYMREFIVNKFKDIKIISMPQSVYFDNSKRAERRKKRCIKIYNNHPNFTLIAREKYSYEKMKKIFANCRIILNPDIVFYLSKNTECLNKRRRAGIITCFRNDKEDILKEKKYELIKGMLQVFDDVTIGDTCVARNITGVIREEEVYSLINQFRKAELIITNRLHGMVLAALSNTPCLVLESLDQKVVGTYEWIKHMCNIKFVSKMDLDEIINEAMFMLKDTNNEQCDWEKFRYKYFEKLKVEIGE